MAASESGATASLSQYIMGSAASSCSPVSFNAPPACCCICQGPTISKRLINAFEVFVRKPKVTVRPESDLKLSELDEHRRLVLCVSGKPSAGVMALHKGAETFRSTWMRRSNASSALTMVLTLAMIRHFSKPHTSEASCRRGGQGRSATKSRVDMVRRVLSSHLLATLPQSVERNGE